MEPIDIFNIIRKRRLATIGLVLLILSISTGGVLFLMERSAKKASAGAVVLPKDYNMSQIDSQNGTTDWANSDVIINQKNVRINGEHSFKNLTIENGGELTTTDFNSYGIYNNRDADDPIFSTVMDPANRSYEFILRGYIFVGNNANTLSFNVTSGNPASWTADATGLHPASMNPDDVASVEFYKSVASGNTYNQEDFNSAPVGHAFGSSSGGTLTYVDAAGANGSTTVDAKFFPFELRFANTAGASNFAITSCLSSSNCAIRDNNTFLNILSHSDDFVTSSVNPQLKTFRAWQGGAKNGGIYSGSTLDYTAFTAHLDSQRSKTAGQERFDYDTNFLLATSYDFKKDYKAVVVNRTDMLSPSARLYTDRTDLNVYDLWRNQNSGINDYLAFYGNSEWYSPLASRITRYFNSYDGDYGWAEINITDSEPILSRAVIESLPVKELTKIKVSGALTVKAGGKINVNGKGFAATRVYHYTPAGTYSVIGHGSGPSPAKMEGSGASHTGISGRSVRRRPPGCVPFAGPNCLLPVDPMPAYDQDPNIDPKLPGSGTTHILYLRNVNPYSGDPTNFYGYGGGYINVEANKIILEANSMIMANGVGGGHSPGAAGGSIILSDSNPDSKYDGIITATGATANGEWAEVSGGGGGYISIKTQINSALSSLRDTNHNLPDSFSAAIQRDPSVDNWTSQGFSSTFISVSGGQVAFGDSGSQGILSVKRFAATEMKLSKTLVPISRNGSANFNPYGALLGDQIKVQIHVDGLAAGTTITDDLLQTNAPSLICGDLTEITPPNTQATPPETLKRIEWIHSTNEVSKDFYYICRMKKL